MQTIEADVEARPEPLTAEQQELFDATVPYAEKLARRRAAVSRSPYEDLLQHGLMGLLDAARKWDESKSNGAKFRTYAKPRIHGAMVDAEREGLATMIRVPRKAWEKLTPDERAASQPKRLDSRLVLADPDWREFRTRDGLEDRRYVSRLDDESIHKAIQSLGGVVAEVVRLYHFAGLNMRRIGERLGYSESRVSQMHSRAMEELRENPRILAQAGRLAQRREAVA